MSFPMMKTADKNYWLVARSFASVHHAGDLGHQGVIGADIDVQLTAECLPFSRQCRVQVGE